MVGKFCNPADKLISIASHPSKAVSRTIEEKGNNAEGKSIEETAALIELEERCKNFISKSMENSGTFQDGYSGRVDVSKVVEAKRVDFFGQFKLVLSRMVVQSMRIPLAMLALVIQGIFAGMLQATVF